MERTAILIATSGGSDTNHWVEAAIAAIGRHTVEPSVYVAASEDDAHARTSAEGRDWCCAVDSGVGHGCGAQLRSLIAAARADGADHVVVLAPGVVPIDNAWLPRLTERTAGGPEIVGIWRHDDDAKRVATCVSMAIEVVERRASVHDTSASPLSAIVDAAVADGVGVVNLQRSNRNALSDFPGGLYDDILYDHALETWAPAPGEADDERARLRSLAADLALDHRDAFVEWMRADQTAGRVFFVLGMHRSGTSALTACLEQCGMYLGKTFRAPLPDHPSGNFERPDATSINDQLLADAGASWSDPPGAPITQGGPEIDELIAELEAHAPAGIKDPRLLYTLDAWTAKTERAAFIGSFRHPAAVAESLRQRDRIAPADGYRLWVAYNTRLVELHRTLGFPLVEFDPHDRLGYSRRVAGAATELGLSPRIHAVLGAVAEPRERADADASEMPADVRALWEYLRTHAVDVPLSEDSFIGLALAWESARTPDPVDEHHRRGLRWPYQLGQRLPPSIRHHVWRVWCKVVGKPRPQ